MTCFWDGIIQSLSLEDFRIISDLQRKPNPRQLAEFLKSKNKYVEHVLCQNEPISEKQKEECFEAIKELNIDRINNGYFCSCFDPFLMLLCELFCIHIIHKYNGTVIEYKNIYLNRKTITYHSSSSHFWH